MSGHISDQIVVYKNDKVLVELRDKLKVASVANLSLIHIYTLISERRQEL